MLEQRKQTIREHVNRSLNKWEPTLPNRKQQIAEVIRYKKQG